MPNRADGQHSRTWLRAVFLIPVGLSAQSALAQSFDCARATTTVERLVCADKQLGELDVSLAAALHKALVTYPARRRELLSDERAWIAERDARCAARAAGKAEAMLQCVAELYRAQIAYLDSLTHPQTAADGSSASGPHANASADVAICYTVADRYRELGGPGLGKPPLAALASSQHSGVTMSEPLGKVAKEDLKGELAGWAYRQDPPFVLDDDLQREWNDIKNEPAVWQVSRLPGTGFYSLSSVQGTAHCISSVYFEVQGRRAHLTSDPAGFEEEGGASCGVGRWYGSIDGRPAYFQELYDYTPRMSSTLTIAPWEHGQFGPACTITFFFAPAFGGETLNPHQESCNGPECDDLRHAALQLVTAVQGSPTNAETQMLAALSPARKSLYDAAVGLSKPHTPTGSDPDSITAEDPLRIPYVHAGQLYAVSLGHFTIGWRYFADWSVRFDAIEDGKLMRRAAFAVGMMKGPLQTLRVESAAR